MRKLYNSVAVFWTDRHSSAISNTSEIWTDLSLTNLKQNLLRAMILT